MNDVQAFCILTEHGPLLSLCCSSVSPVVMSMTGVRWAAESLRSAQLASSGIQWRFHREKSSAPSHRPLARRGWHSVTEPLSPIPRPIFSAPAEGAFCLFIYLLEMNKRYREPSVRICKRPSHLQTCECIMKVVIMIIMHDYTTGNKLFWCSHSAQRNTILWPCWFLMSLFVCWLKQHIHLLHTSFHGPRLGSGGSTSAVSSLLF